MGWSCAVRAGWVLDAWTDKCVKLFGSQNTYKVGADEYFFERANKEHADGAISGSIFKLVAYDPHGNARCRRCGSFRIEGNGEVTRAPKFLKDCSPTKEQLEAKYQEIFCRPTPEERVRRNHEAFEADKKRREMPQLIQTGTEFYTD